MRRAADTLVRRWWSGGFGAGGAVLSMVLAPAELAYRTAVKVRARAYAGGVLRTARAPVPVLSVGNVTVGGTGKTPFTRWLADRLRTRGHLPAIVHGGYADDEPALHRAWAPVTPVLVSRDRAAAAAAAAAAGATVVVLDDAFQHLRVHRDLDIVLVSAERWAGPARMLPRGPWREPRQALARADVTVVVRRTATPADARRVATEVERLSGRPAVALHLRAARWRRAGDGPASGAASAPGGPVLAVSAVAEPDLFVANARSAGAQVAAALSFPDHHVYSAADMARIRAEAGDRPVVTTEKDWVKLRAMPEPPEVWLLIQEVIVEGGLEILDDALEEVLG
ncbi:MAG TPA: tetraacyldisaccharide 4'-kinase [Longimicrobiales bacterium]|nr:tetraacyldisaccharide 4'-kinase [Longimicrobiales bacterium]